MPRARPVAARKTATAPRESLARRYTRIRYQTDQVTLADFPDMINEETHRLTELWQNVINLKSKSCDCKFMVIDKDGSKVAISANKIRLMEMSPFFHSFFNDPTGMEESDDEVELPGLTLQAARAVIAVSFQQFGSVLLKKEYIADYLYAGLKYDVKPLLDCSKELVEKWAESQIGDSRLDDCFEVIIKLHQSNLTEYAAELLNKTGIFEKIDRIKHVFLSTIAMDFPFDLFSEIVKSDTLAISEIRIWKRCIAWAEARSAEEIIEDLEGDSKKSEKRKVVCEQLKKLKTFVRFPLMKIEDLLTLTEWEEIITPMELLEIYKVKSGADSSNLFCSALPRYQGIKSEPDFSDSVVYSPFMDPPKEWAF